MTETTEDNYRQKCGPCPYADSVESIRAEIHSIREFVETALDGLPDRVMKVEIVQAQHRSQIHDCEVDRKDVMEKAQAMKVDFAVLVESLEPLKEQRRWFVMMVIGFVSMTGATVFQILTR